MKSQKIEQSTENIDNFLKSQKDQDLVRFITCGSVDDGKSTLIGRLLWESQQIFDDQLTSLKAESKKYGTQGSALDFALLVDGLSAEREQGITIDVAYRYFSTPHRKFIIADTPGHEQYTRNMITAASTANLAIILIDAQHGIQAQTKRHAFLASLIGIKNIVLAINKMDLVHFSEDSFNHIHQEFLKFSNTLNFEKITSIPISALNGDNITQRSPNTSWYIGPTLIAYLETIQFHQERKATDVVFPIQWVNRPNSSFRGFCGTLLRGSLSVGDTVKVTQSGKIGVIKEIITSSGEQETASPNQAITITLNEQIDISRGDIITSQDSPIETTDQLEATIIWLNEKTGIPGRNYDLKIASQWVGASITKIKHRIDINDLTKQSANQLDLNDIAMCQLATSKRIGFENYLNLKDLGSFILVDRETNATVAAGMITNSLRRSQNIHIQPLTIERKNREHLNGHKGKVVWFTGLSGSGKSTLANALEIKLHSQGFRTYILDGDNVRHGLNKNLGFTESDRVENIRRVSEVAKLMLDSGLIVITSFISPYREDRNLARELIGHDDFLEVYLDTSLATCEQRDPKGLYKKARQGLIPNMTGINSPYEPPLDPDLSIDTLNEDVESITRRLSSLIMQSCKPEIDLQ